MKLEVILNKIEKLTISDEQFDIHFPQAQMTWGEIKKTEIDYCRRLPKAEAITEAKLWIDWATTNYPNKLDCDIEWEIFFCK